MAGKVAQITDFGAFVDVEGVRGLVHKSEIGRSRGPRPAARPEGRPRRIRQGPEGPAVP